MGLESGTYIDDLVAANPPTTDSKQQGDDHLRLIKTVTKNTFPRAGKPFPFFTYLEKTANYVVLSTDEHTFFSGDGTGAVVGFTLPNLAAADKGWYAIFRAKNITNAVTLTPSSGTINGAASYTFSIAGQTVLAWFDGSNWFVQSDQVVDIVNLTALTAPASGDSLVIYDLSATANRKIALDQLFKIINGLSSEASPATDDVLAIYDTSEAAANSMTFANFLKVVNALTEDTTPDLSADFLLSYDTSASAVKKVKPQKADAFSAQLFHVQDQKASGANGGGFTAGAWRVRDLNTVVTNEISGASLAANQMSLPAGTYYAEASAPAGLVNQHKTRLQNITDATTLVEGTSEMTSPVSAVYTRSWSMGRFTLAATKTVEFQHQCNTSRGTDGFGLQGSIGSVETYAEVRIWKIG